MDDINELVARHVFGADVRWKRGRWQVKMHPTKSRWRYVDYGNYLDDAFQIVRHLAITGWWFTLEAFTRNEQLLYRALFAKGGKDYRAERPYVAEAISMAALHALNVLPTRPASRNGPKVE